MAIAVDFEKLHILANDIECIRHHYNDLAEELATVAHCVEQGVFKGRSVAASTLKNVQHEMQDIAAFLRLHAKYLTDTKYEYIKIEKKACLACGQISGSQESGAALNSKEATSYMHTMAKIKNLSLIEEEQLAFSTVLPDLREIGVEIINSSSYVNDEVAVNPLWLSELAQSKA